MLVLGAENRNGANPFPPVGGPPQYLSYYTDALDALGVGYDVYDTDAQGSHSADPLGVLSHYDMSSGTRATTSSPGCRPSPAARASPGSRSSRWSTRATT